MEEEEDCGLTLSQPKEEEEEEEEDDDYGGLLGVCADDDVCEDEVDFGPGGFFGVEEGDEEVPLEVALRIFALLSPRELARAELVCRRWYHTIGPTSPHLAYLWRQVFERHLGTVSVKETSKDDRSERVRRMQDWRTKCLSGAQTVERYMQDIQNNRLDLLRWAIRLGYDVLLAELLATNTDIVDLLRSYRKNIRRKAAYTRYANEDYNHPILLAVEAGSLPLLEIVATHAGVVPMAITQTARKGSLEALEILLSHFIEQVQGLNVSEPSRQSQEKAHLIVAEQAWSEADWDQLQEVLKEGGLEINKLFLNAVEACRFKLVEHLVSRCPSSKRGNLLSAVNSRDCTALLETVRNGSKRIFFLLLPLVSDKELRRVAHRAGKLNALTMAIKRADIEMVTALLDRGLSADGEDYSHPIPLCMAASVESENRMEIIKLLLQRGANINATATKSGKTVLHAACSLQKVDEQLITFLLEEGADIHAMMKGSTVLGSLLSFSPHPHELWREATRIQVFKMLHERGVTVQLEEPSLIVRVLGWFKDISGWPVESGSYAKGEEAVEEMLQLLISMGCQTRESEYVILHKLVALSSPRIIRLMVGRLGLDITKDLSYLVTSGRLRPNQMLANAQALLELGANPNVLVYGQPFIVVVCRQEPDLLRLLVKYGANIRAVGVDRMPILHSYLSEWWGEGPDRLKLLIELGADINARDREGRTVSEYAVNRTRLKSQLYAVLDQAGIQYPPDDGSEASVDDPNNFYI